MVETRAIASPTTHSTPALDFRDIRLTYHGKGAPLTVIDQISFRVARGEFVSLVGPSGCGKTTLLRMVSGLNPAEEGAVYFHGQPIIGPLKNIGIAFQNPVLLPWRNTLNNVLLPLEVVQPHKRRFRQNRAKYVEAAEQLLATVGLSSFHHHYPWQLSGGMRQRASLCRALIHQPEILLLDEPFAALDAFTREEMWGLTQNLWQQTGCTALLVTHDLREALFLSDTIYVLGPRPSTLVYELAVNLPRPRTLDLCFTDEFHHMYTELRRHIQRS
ncbi:MAG: nitrate ABC transporter ATP-binding protein [Leptolyngbya sp.]|jgi:NitT/TauT family transport system ATP-binding protein|nr:MAG: nitrate ABC transporter ATP-binding protein [Leptolyngbya sp.]